MMEGLIGGLFPYMAVGIFLVGAGVRIILWQTAPRKLNWKLYPVPEGLAGEASYILGEWVSFRTLFRHNRIVWLGSYVFHLSLVWLVVWLVLFLLGIHLPWLLRTALWGMFGSAVYLFIVRLWVKQMRAISSLVEYLNLLLFILIASSGLSMLGRGVGGQVTTGWRRFSERLGGGASIFQDLDLGEALSAEAELMPAEGGGKHPPEAKSFGRSSAGDMKRREMPPPHVTRRSATWEPRAKRSSQSTPRRRRSRGSPGDGSTSTSFTGRPTSRRRAA
jgi:hypothetical protein